MRNIAVLFIASALLFGLSCGKNDDDKSFNIFSVEKDIELGQQLDADIRSNPQEYPILDETQYADAYAHLRRIRDNILNSGQVFYKDEFLGK